MSSRVILKLESDQLFVIDNQDTGIGAHRDATSGKGIRISTLVPFRSEPPGPNHLIRTWSSLLQLCGQRLDDPQAQTATPPGVASELAWHYRCRNCKKQAIIRATPKENSDIAAGAFGKGMLQGVRYEFGHEQSQRNSEVEIYRQGVGLHGDGHALTLAARSKQVLPQFIEEGTDIEGFEVARMSSTAGEPAQGRRCAGGLRSGSAPAASCSGRKTQGR